MLKICVWLCGLTSGFLTVRQSQAVSWCFQASVLWGKKVHQHDTLILAPSRIWHMSPHWNDIINSFQGSLTWLYSSTQHKERKETSIACYSFIKMSDGCENFLLIYYIWNISLISTVLKLKLFYLVRRIMFTWRLSSWFVNMPMLSQIPKFEVKKNQQWARRKHCGFGGSVGHCNWISDRGAVRPTVFD